MRLSVVDTGLMLLPYAAGAIAVAGIIHIATVLIYPQQARDDAFARVVALAPLGNKAELLGGASPTFPDQDPAMRAVVCRFDLAHGPFRLVTEPLDEGFLSIGMYSRTGIAFYGLNLRAGEGGALSMSLVTGPRTNATDTLTSETSPADLRIAAPETEGFILVEAPRAGVDGGRDALSHVTCNQS